VIFDESNVIDEAFDEHRDFWGRKHLDRCIRQLIEEQAELTIELLKFQREENGEMMADPDRVKRILGELADVLVCLEFIGRVFRFDRQAIGDAVDSRCARLEVKVRRLQYLAKNGGTVGA
jgi:NTP pyrophosphatase (non-canonical NTP hydrolase)